MVRTEREMTGVYGPVLLTTYPAPEGFINRYVLCLTPIVLVVISLIVLTVMLNMVNSFLPALGNSRGMIVPDLPVIIDICAFLISPVGIFLFFIYLGDVLHRAELWAGAALTLLLSLAGALVLVQGMNIPVLSTTYLHTLVQWIAYLVQPFSVIAAVGVLAGIELFRRSLEYTITRDVVIITGGIWNLVENVIPFHTIERIVVVQDFLGHFFHTGIVVPQGLIFGNRDIDMREHHPAGYRLLPKPDHGHTLSWQAAAHNPLVCLFGVRDPERVKMLLEKARKQNSERDRE